MGGLRSTAGEWQGSVPVIGKKEIVCSVQCDALICTNEMGSGYAYSSSSETVVAESTEDVPSLPLMNIPFLNWVLRASISVDFHFGPKVFMSAREIVDG